jgi:hypothetical protein
MLPRLRAGLRRFGAAQIGSYGVPASRSARGTLRSADSGPTYEAIRLRTPAQEVLVAPVNDTGDRQGEHQDRQGDHDDDEIRRPRPKSTTRALWEVPAFAKAFKHAQPAD